MNKVTLSLIGLIIACMATGCSQAIAKNSEPEPIPVKPTSTPIVVPSPSPTSPVPSNLDTSNVAKNKSEFVPEPQPKQGTNNSYNSEGGKGYATIQLVKGYNYANLYKNADSNSEVLRQLNYGDLVWLTGVTTNGYRQAVTVDENISGWLIIR